MGNGSYVSHDLHGNMRYLSITRKLKTETVESGPTLKFGCCAIQHRYINTQRHLYNGTINRHSKGRIMHYVYRLHP